MSLNAYFLYFCLNFIEKIMKKVLAIAFIGGLLVVNCSKKPDHTLQDTNTMLPEPDAPTVVDSTAKKAAPVAATTPAPATEAAKTDSTAAKK
jgi:hypothetical protein